MGILRRNGMLYVYLEMNFSIQQTWVYEINKML
jgi:hypothetical protein